MTTARGTVGLVPRRAKPRRVALGWAFVERQTNLWKRYWAWELVWLVYGVVNTLAITFIAKEAGRTGLADPAHVRDLTLFLLIGTLAWAYLSAILDDMSLVIMWERWEGTIEHTFMTPVSRVVHLLGMSVFAVLHATIRTALILACSLPFFRINLEHADWPTAALVVVVGSVSLVGLGICTAILPMLYPERGEQMSFMVQALVLLVSGVYYGIDILPGWLQAAAHLSPATYLLRGVRAAVIDGSSVAHQLRTLAILVVFGVVMVPASLALFAAAERWAKKTGRLKRLG
ncbi:MAG TPA: ABC transporter permease [Acidimicrobiales bacterium]|nr:ABC transporter permease [Acidimicrobiales bacterium]